MNCENTYWTEKFSGRIIEVLDLEYIYDDENYFSENDIMGVNFRYADDGTRSFIGTELFLLNYNFYKETLSRLDQVI